ncbi:hypothetical protein [Leptospira yanagawae]|uniref:hypothetical protein n=1 Tax=Leptospira yanagawae TaxID=293069 RepID=UPI0012EC0919|nr:hypothetical protein [Leptospira yanagawae]
MLFRTLFGIYGFIRNLPISIKNLIKLNDFLRSISSSLDKTVVIFHHGMGGGSEKFINLKYPSSDYSVFQIGPKNGNNRLLSISFLSFSSHFIIDTFFMVFFVALIQKFSRQFKIIINHFSGLENQDLIRVHRTYKISEIYIHDYFAICPFYFLSPNDVFCGLPDLEGCNQCINSKLNGLPFRIQDFRTKYDSLLLTDNIKIFAPSRSVEQNFKKVYPEIKLDIFNEFNHPKIIYRKRVIKNKTIGIFGHLTFHKGRSLVEQFLKYSPNSKIVLIGESDPIISNYDNFQETGRYSDDKSLENFIDEFRLDLVWFPVRIPETFSFTLSMAINKNLFIFAPNVGSFPERLENYPSCQIFHYNSSQNQIFDQLIQLTL